MCLRLCNRANQFFVPLQQKHLLRHHLRLHTRDPTLRSSRNRVRSLRSNQPCWRDTRCFGWELCERRDDGSAFRVRCTLWATGCPELVIAIRESRKKKSIVLRREGNASQGGSRYKIYGPFYLFAIAKYRTIIMNGKKLYT